MTARAQSPEGPQSDMPTEPLADVVDRLTRELHGLRAAADERALVELAKGVLVGRLRCSPVQAARQLAVLAGQAGVAVAELAADIVGEVAGDRFAMIGGPAVPAEPARPGQPGQPPPRSAAVRLRTAESGALAGEDMQAVARSLLDHALAPLGAIAVAVWKLGADTSLTLAGQAGFAAADAEQWHHVPPDVATVARQSLDDPELVWAAPEDRGEAPSIGRRRITGARIALPALSRGRVNGVLEICWPGRLPAPPPQVRHQLEALAELCAQTLETLPAGPVHTAVLPHDESHDRTESVATELVALSELLDGPALVLVPVFTAHGAPDDFVIRHVNHNFADPLGRPRERVEGLPLSEAFPATADQDGLLGAVRHVHATGEPFRRERATGSPLGDAVPPAHLVTISVSRLGGAVLVAWQVHGEAARHADLLRHAERLGRIGGFEEDVAAGTIMWNAQLFALHGLPHRGAAPIPLEELPQHAHPEDAVQLDRFLRTLFQRRRPASVAFRLRRPGGQARQTRIIAEPVLAADGRLLAVRGACQDISAQRMTEVALEATRHRLAHSEQESAERNLLARQLQHAIMPPLTGPLTMPGLEVAVRYRPAESDAAVGGDWYDAALLPSKQVLLCVGDVAGHGIDAATSMVVLRNALRGLAVTGVGPARMLGWLNTVTHHLTDGVTATALCGLYDPDTRVLRWARAGHLPPVWIRGDGAETLPLIDGPLLGAFADAVYHEDEVQLQPNDTLVMYTDGLIERRDRAVNDVLDQLVAASRVSVPSLEHRLDRLLDQSGSNTDDDTCVVGIEVV